MILMDMTVTDFSAELASLSPAPGGGTIAAVNGVFAAGLGSMVCALSLRKPRDADAAALFMGLLHSERRLYPCSTKYSIRVQHLCRR